MGGRAYRASQLNHVSARRQPGSSFKPFVYAAALNSGVDGSQPLITLATILADQPTTFEFGGQPSAGLDVPANCRIGFSGLTKPGTRRRVKERMRSNEFVGCDLVYILGRQNARVKFRAYSTYLPHHGVRL